MERIPSFPRIASLILLLLLCSPFSAQAQDADTSTLLREGDQAFEQGNFSEAQARFEQAFKIFEQADQKEGMASASFSLGTAYSRVGKYAEAEEALHRALQLHKSLQDRNAIAADMLELGYVARKQSRYDESLQFAQNALAIYAESGNRKGIADSYRCMGAVYQFQGDHEKSLDYSTRSLSIALEIGDKSGQVKSLTDLGGLQWRMGNLDAALDYFQKALPLAAEIGNLQSQAKLFGNTALVYWNRGQLNEALDYFKKSQALAEQMKDQQTASINYFNMGAVYKDLEEYGKAHEFLEKALALSEEIGDRGLTQACMDALGQLHAETGEYDIALDFMQKAAAIAEEIGEKRSLAYDQKSIASLHASRRRFSEAIASYRKALALYEELQEKRGIALTLNDLAEISLALKKDKEAFAYYEKALAIATEIKSNFILQDSYRGEGWIHYARKEMPQAEECFTKSVDLAREIERPGSIWAALYGKSLVYRDTGKLEESLQLMKEAVEIIEQVRSGVELAEQKAGYMEEKLDVYEDLIALLVKTGNYPEAFEYAQRAKARAFLDLLVEGRIHPEGKVDATLVERKKKLMNKLADVQRNIQGESENDSVDQVKIRKLAKQRTELEYEFNKLTLEIRKADARFADLQYPRPLTLEEVQGLLDSRTALLEYSLGRVESLLFVITTDGVHVHSVPSEQKLAAGVREIRAVLVKPEAVWEISEDAHTRYVAKAVELYRELIAPAGPDLVGKKALVIAPDGILNYLPFESLLSQNVADKNFSLLPYLALDFEMEYVPSGTVLAALARDPVRSANVPLKEFLAFADPEDPPSGPPSGIRNSNLLPLPNTRVEVEAIARLFSGDRATIFLGQEASEQNLKKLQLDQYKRLHFANHGVIDEERPQFSSVVLKGTANGEDGYLMMREVYDLNLQADLVVLSGCKTGLGQQVRGEGIMGLSRAFLSAGAASVLASLWNVPDESTSAFMISFYESLVKKGMRNAAAVKRARLELIHSSNFSHPYYWAPFVLIGKP